MSVASAIIIFVYLKLKAKAARMAASAKARSAAFQQIGSSPTTPLETHVWLEKIGAQS